MGDDGGRGKARYYATRWQFIMLCFILAVLVTACNHSSSTTGAPKSTPRPLSDVDNIGHATPEPFPTLAGEDESRFLETALSMFPSDVPHFAFTHWYRIKRHYLVPELTSEFDPVARDRFTKRVLMDDQYGAMMNHGKNHSYFQQLEFWGWDHHDLVWEASGDYGKLTSFIRIQRFRSNFDFDRLADLLQDRDFITSTYRNVEIFSVPFTKKSDWHNASPLEIHSMALFPDEDLLVLSPYPEGVQKVIDAREGVTSLLGDDPLIKRSLFKLLGAFAVELFQGLETCERFGAGQFDKGRNINAAVSQLNEWPAQPYELMAAGHFIAEGEQKDVVLFHYDDYRQAEADFEKRENLFRFGSSPMKPGVAYASQFILEQIELEDALMTFQLIPSLALSDRYGWPQTIIGWIQEQDALFAACEVQDFLGMDELQ
jgi:hypothetical protein